MELLEFCDLLMDEIEAQKPEGMRVIRNTVTKNNGVSELGITLSKPGESVSPNIYIGPCFEAFLQGKPLGSIAADIISQSEEAGRQLHFDTEEFVNWDRARQRIVFKLVNRQWNEKLLEEIPYQPYMDLAMVFYYLLPPDGKQDTDDRAADNATILIHNSHLNMWQVKSEEVAAVAGQNTPRLLPAAIIGMGELLKKLMSGRQIPEELVENCGLYVMSNASRINGAATMAYPDAVRRFADSCGKNLYIIPSSVHEVILIPETGREQGLNEMVAQVNETQLDPKEVLADHVYYYDRKESRISSVLRESASYC